MTLEQTIQVARKVMQNLHAEDNVGVVVGTAGLQLHGWPTNPPDLDVLVAKPRTGHSYEELFVDGFRVNLIDDVGSPKHTQFFHPERAKLVSGVQVASMADIIGLKRAADREKDREFLKAWDAWSLWASTIHPLVG